MGGAGACTSWIIPPIGGACRNLAFAADGDYNGMLSVN